MAHALSRSLLFGPQNGRWRRRAGAGRQLTCKGAPRARQVARGARRGAKRRCRYVEITIGSLLVLRSVLDGAKLDR
ncbi:hypothetical protein [Sorangium sp. So ce1153]|uniref:hypothetical protein n=1 Tax=Sorangium sp. So ce1153 TaxID=3133333 RepID=UPI003F62AAFD